MPTIPRSLNGRITKRPKNLYPEQTGDQTGNATPDNSLFYAGALLFPNGGTSFNPMAFPGYGRLYTGSYSTYRWMLQHPILRLVRAIRYDPILASSWEYKAADRRRKVPNEWVDSVKRCFNKLRAPLMRDYLVRGGDYGWSGGEVCWDISEDQYQITRVKPLLVDSTTILTDKGGNFIGLENKGKSGKDLKLWAPYKAWKYTYDSEAGYHYGRPWLENARMIPWRGWLDCAQQLAKLAGKITGIITLIQSPAGTFPVVKGGQQTTMTYKQAALEVISALAGGAAGAWYPSLTLTPDSKGSVDIVKYVSELAGKSLTKFEVLNFGNQSAAIDPILKQMKNYEDQMFAAGLRSARTGLEGVHGTKEEAGVHTDTGTTNAEQEDEDFAVQCQSLVNAFLTANYGEQAYGAVEIAAPSLIDRKSSILRAILLALLAEPSIRKQMAKSSDWKTWCSVLDVPQSGEFDKTKLDDPEPKQPASQKKNVEPEGGRPTQAARKVVYTTSKGVQVLKAA